MDSIKLFLKFSFGIIISFLISVLTTIYVTRIFSPENYAKFSIFSVVITTIMVFATLGLDNSFVRFFNEYEKDKRPYLLKECIKRPILVITFISFISILFYREISFYIVGEQSFLLIILFIFSIFFETLSRFAVLVIRMQKKGVYYSLIQISIKLLNVIFIIFFLIFFEQSSLLLITAYAFAVILSSIFALLSDYRFWKKTISKQKNVLQIDLLKYSYPFVISGFLMVINENIDKFIIREYLSDYDLGIYFSAFKLVMIVAIFQSLISTLLVPIYYERYSKDKNDHLFFINSSDVVILIMFVVSALFIVAKDIVILLLGNDYRDAMIVLPLLLFGPLMYTISETIVVGINFEKKTKYHIYIAILIFVFNLSINFILVPMFGVLGAAISFSLYSILYLILRSIFSYKSVRIKFGYKKLALSTTIFYIYSILSIWFLNYVQNVVFGIIVIFLLIMIYWKILSYSIKLILNTRKKGNL